MPSVNRAHLPPVVSPSAAADEGGIVWGDEDISFLIKKGYLPNVDALSVKDIQAARRKYLIDTGKIDVERERDEKIDRVAGQIAEVTGYVTGGAAAGAVIGAVSAAVVGASVAAGAVVGAVCLPAAIGIGVAALFIRR